MTLKPAVTTCLRKSKSQNQGCHHCCKVSSCQQLQSNSVKRAVLPALQPAYSYFFISHNKNSNSPPLCPKTLTVSFQTILRIAFFLLPRTASSISVGNNWATKYIVHTYTLLQNHTQVLFSAGNHGHD